MKVSFKRPGWLAAVLALLCGCTTNPITGRSQFVMVSEESAISGSASAYSNITVSLLAIGTSSRNDTSAMGRNESLYGIAAALAITLPNSRESESEADQIGIELAARAGYDPRAAVSLWKKMAAERGGPPEFLSTHPAPENRMGRLATLVAQVDPYYQKAKETRDTAQIPTFIGMAANERAVDSISLEEYAAKIYYARALEAQKDGKTCDGTFNTCEGFDIPKLIRAASK
jgi:predicted Zn-dependent protease